MLSYDWKFAVQQRVVANSQLPTPILNTQEFLIFIQFIAHFNKIRIICNKNEINWNKTETRWWLLQLLILFINSHRGLLLNRADRKMTFHALVLYCRGERGMIRHLPEDDSPVCRLTLSVCLNHCLYTRFEWLIKRQFYPSSTGIIFKNSLAHHSIVSAMWCIQHLLHLRCQG